MSSYETNFQNINDKGIMANDHAAGPLNQKREVGTKSATAAATTHKSTERGREEKEESSTSTGSDGGKGNSSGSGSGSGSGGYNADCSSSDSSSNNDAATNVAEKHKTKLNNGIGSPTKNNNDVGGKVSVSKMRTTPTTGCISAKSVAGSKSSFLAETHTPSEGERSTQHRKTNSHTGKSKNFSDTTMRRNRDDTNVVSKESGPCLPQWNGITIEHPMDPRIDLSTVGFSIGSSHHTPFLTNNIDIKKSSKTESTKSHESQNQVNSSCAKKNTNISSKSTFETNSSNIPSIEQYTKLLECVRPFFSAHGITAKPNTTHNSITHESHKDVKASSESNTAIVDILNTAKSELAAAYTTVAGAAREDDKDSSSMVVLARPKKKHSSKQEGTDSNSGRSASSCEEETRLRHPQQQEAQQGAGHEDVAINENGSDGNGQVLMEDPRQQPLQHQNLPGNPQHYEFPTMISEYSSSGRNRSSEASNTNIMSTSGSGSGGNTASGTGSGSNQGGSSGSGNDQGGMSSNGNGSSGSGNDKGSSEEMMDHNIETNSAENSKDNSAQCSSSDVKNKPDVLDNANAPRFSPNPSEPSSQRRLSGRSNDNQSQNAAREKKLLDKKRKRMNMRRVYEDQMEQDMGTSDSSNNKEAIRPGKPVTLDNAVSFTKTAKLVVKSGPSFTVIYTNAAYSRLSGIDSHSAVGNPISLFLSLPSQQISHLDYEKEGPLPSQTTIEVNQSEKYNVCDHNHTATDSNNHIAAEAAGRARAAASCDDSITGGIEKLIVASGHGQLVKINIRCKPHKMLGRNVRVFKSMVQRKRNQEEGSNGSNGSSITSSYDGPFNFVKCNMSISPVVSSPEMHLSIPTIGKEKKAESHHNKSKRNDKEHDSHQQKLKRRKHHHIMNEIVHNRKRQVISHYVIQLEPHEGDSTKNDAERGSRSSLSTDAGARMLGLKKNEGRQQQVIPSTVNAGKQLATSRNESVGSENQK